MNIAEINQKYPNNELASLPGDEELKRELFAPLLNNLFENKVVYHERFTCIARLDEIELLPDMFMAKVTALNLIEKGNKMDRLMPQNPWKFGAKWSYLRLINTSLAGYGSWLIWTDPETVRKVELMTLSGDFKAALQMTLYNEESQSKIRK